MCGEVQHFRGAVQCVCAHIYRLYRIWTRIYLTLHTQYYDIVTYVIIAIYFAQTLHYSIIDFADIRTVYMCTLAHVDDALRITSLFLFFFIFFFQCFRFHIWALLILNVYGVDWGDGASVRPLVCGSVAFRLINFIICDCRWKKRCTMDALSHVVSPTRGVSRVRTFSHDVCYNFIRMHSSIVSRLQVGVP